jgi:hypothetical protein
VPFYLTSHLYLYFYCTIRANVEREPGNFILVLFNYNEVCLILKCLLTVTEPASCRPTQSYAVHLLLYNIVRTFHSLLSNKTSILLQELTKIDISWATG